METINDRIETLINKYFDGNKAAFAKSIGLPPTGMSNYLGKQRRSKPSIDMVVKIISTLNVDPLWLLIGKESESIDVRSAGRDYAERGGIHHHVNEYNGSCSEAKTDLEKENAALKQKLIEAQERIIKLMEGVKQQP